MTETTGQLGKNVDHMTEAADATQEIRYGFIGVGMMGQEHIRNVQALPGARVVALADPELSSLAAAQNLVSSEVSSYASTSEMLAKESLDAVVISSPNFTHHSVLEPLWNTSLNLLIEKPMCTTVHDCLQVQAAAQSHQGIVWVGLEYRYMPPVQRFLAELSSSDKANGSSTGQVRMLSIREHRYPFLEKVDNWNRFSANTGGTLVEKCCHFFDLMRLAIHSAPLRVMASGAQDVNHLDEHYPQGTPDILDNAYVIVEFANGARASLDLSMFAEGSAFEQELVAVGDLGKVEVKIPGFMELSRGRQAELIVGSRGTDWPVTTSLIGAEESVGYLGAHHGASYLEHVDFCNAIRNGSDALVTVEDGLWSVAMGAAAQISLTEGRMVSLAELELS
ncbi:MAG: Gfo/Idh/MocA family oxidoreductase [Microthrixaceae bacterium]